MTTKWIQKAIKHRGSLHRMLDVPEGKKIPVGKMQSALKSKDPLKRRRAILAKTLSKFK